MTRRPGNEPGMAPRPNPMRMSTRLFALSVMVLLLAAALVSIKRNGPVPGAPVAAGAAGAPVAATAPEEPGSLRGSLGLSVSERTGDAPRAMESDDSPYEAAARLGGTLGRGLAGNDPQIPWGELALAKWDLPEPSARAVPPPSDTPVVSRLVRRVLASQIFLWFVGVALVGVPLASMLWTELDRRRADRELELLDAPELVYAPFFRQSEPVHGPLDLPDGWDRALPAGHGEDRTPMSAGSPRPLQGGKILAHPPWMQPAAAFEPLPPTGGFRLAS